MDRILLALLVAASVSAAAPSPKRGVCAKNLSAEDFAALAPGVSWWYDWYFEPDAVAPAGGPRFVPMLWGDSPDLWRGATGAIEARPPVMLALNEPNLKGQAFLAPAAAAKAWLRLDKLARRRGVSLVGPQMAIGSAPADSITARDPIQRKDVTYTFMVPYLDAFRAALPRGTKLTLAIHPYGNVGELKWAVGEIVKRYGGPVWVTEFNDWKAADEDASMAYMKEAVAFMEASPDVAGYAWFMARLKDQPARSLLAAEPGKLTRLGRLYVELPAAARP